MYLYGMPVIINEHLVNWKQIRFPKSKKKRIRKKWEKQHKNWQATPEPDVFIDKVNQVVYAHPITAEKLRHQLDKQYKSNKTAYENSLFSSQLYPYGNPPLNFLINGEIYP